MDRIESIIKAAIIAVKHSQSDDLRYCWLTCACEASAKKAMSIICIMRSINIILRLMEELVL